MDCDFFVCWQTETGSLSLQSETNDEETARQEVPGHSTETDEDLRESDGDEMVHILDEWQ